MEQQENMFLRAFKSWLPFAVVIVVFSFLIYAAVQQDYRQSANDPQIQVANDIATAITQGQAAPDTIVPPTPSTDIAQSLSAFVVVYSSSTTPIGSSVSLNGKLPTLPSGVFDYAKAHGEDRFTWQPEKGVRVAAVVKYFNGPVSGYVLAGRSLTEIEKRESRLALTCCIAGLIALVLVYLVLVLIQLWDKKPATMMPSSTETSHMPEHKM